MAHSHSYYMQRAIALAKQAMDSNSGGPFGAIVVKDDVIIAEGSNKVTSTNDPTSHAEIVAIRRACEKLNSFQLTDCIIYTSCEPCPMCLGAIYWSRPKKVYYACTKEDAASINFDDQFIYDEIDTPLNNRSILFENINRKESKVLFEKWLLKEDKIDY